jgi:putative chitinase
MITEALLTKVCRQRGASPKPALVGAMASEKANALYAEYGISADPDIMAAFMANVCHETGGLSLIRENPNYSAKNLHKVWPMWYGVGKKGRDGKVNRDSDGDGLSDLAEEHGGNPVQVMSYNYNRPELGNRKGTTDGYDYRGGGPLQSTGREMYMWLEKITGLPFGSKPQTIENPEHWPLVACLTFVKRTRNLCTYAEAGNFEAVCKAINCGSPTSTIKVVGMEDRLAWYRAWKTALGSQPKKPAALLYKVGSPKSAAVEAIQARLNALMYGEGKLNVDGDYGIRTRSAVTDFQMENDIEPADGIVGPKTWEAIFAKDAKCYPPPMAAQLGIASLRKLGDPEVKQQEQSRALGVLLGLGGGFQVADAAGAVEALGEIAKSASGAQGSVQTILEATRFGANAFLPIMALFIGFLLIRRYGAWCYERFERWSRPIGSDEAGA